MTSEMRTGCLLVMLSAIFKNKLTEAIRFDLILLRKSRLVFEDQI